MAASFVIAVFIAAADENYINTASIFELGFSARVLGMGGAFIGLADDGAAVYYNPAGLVLSSETRFSSCFTRPFNTFSYGGLGLVQPGWGGYLLILDSDTLEERDLYGNPIRTFRYTETGVVLGLGWAVSHGLSFGLQIKLYGLVFPSSGFGLALSPCLFFHQGGFSCGVIWRNRLNTPIRYADGHTEPWIPDIAVGITWRDKSILCSIDFTENLITRGDISCVRLGAEYVGFFPLVIRAGANRDWSSFGFSVYWDNLRLDFAYLLHSFLPETYILSLEYQWR